MNVNGISLNNTGAQSFKTQNQQGNDSYSKNIQNQIANAQKQMQEIGENKEMSLEEKMKKRQEIQQQISDLQNQLRQHQIEQRKEIQQKKGTSMNDMLGGGQQVKHSSKGGNGMSSASMQAIISADSSMAQVKVQGAAKKEVKGKAGVLEAEIKLDSGRGGDVEKKKEELAKTKEKAQEIENSQMNAISDINKKLNEAAKEDREAEKTEKTEEKEKAKKKEAERVKLSDGNEPDKTGTDNISNENDITPAYYIPIDIVSDGITVSGMQASEPEGKNVDIKL